MRKGEKYVKSYPIAISRNKVWNECPEPFLLWLSANKNPLLGKTHSTSLSDTKKANARLRKFESVKIRAETTNY